MDADIAQTIKAAGIERVSISIDGLDAATHDAFRGQPGSYERALNGVALLRSVGVPVQLNCSVGRHNVHQLPGLMRLAEDVGAQALHIFMLVPVGCGLTMPPETKLPPAKE